MACKVGEQQLVFCSPTATKLTQPLAKLRQEQTCSATPQMCT